MEVVVRMSRIARREAEDTGAEWLDALAELFGDITERTDYYTLKVIVPTSNAREKLDDIVYKAADGLLEIIDLDPF